MLRIYLGACHARICLACSQRYFYHAHFAWWFEIRGGCGISDKDTHIKAAGITSEVTLEKSNSEGAMVIFALQTPSLAVMAVCQTR